MALVSSGTKPLATLWKNRKGHVCLLLFSHKWENLELWTGYPYFRNTLLILEQIRYSPNVGMYESIICDALIGWSCSGDWQSRSLCTVLILGCNLHGVKVGRVEVVDSSPGPIWCARVVEASRGICECWWRWHDPEKQCFINKHSAVSDPHDRGKLPHTDQSPTMPALKELCLKKN